MNVATCMFVSFPFIFHKYVETTVARKILQCELGVKFDTPDGPTLDIYYPPNPPS